MALCPSCWGAATLALKARGLDKFMAEDRGQAARLMNSEHHVGQNKANYEPMNYLLRLLAGEAMLVAGPGVAMLAKKGCIVCLVGTPEWFAPAADYALEEARRLGIVITPPDAVTPPP